LNPGQYTSIRFTEHLALEGIAPSIGSVGDAYDNALMEGVIGLFKTECINTTLFHDGPYKTLADVEYATAGWADWYNHRRLHGSLGYIPPGRIRASPLRCPHPAGAAHMTAARNPGRFRLAGEPAPGLETRNRPITRQVLSASFGPDRRPQPRRRPHPDPRNPTG
jgi:hypothetical protein